MMVESDLNKEKFSIKNCKSERKNPSTFFLFPWAISWIEIEELRGRKKSFLWGAVNDVELIIVGVLSFNWASVEIT